MDLKITRFTACGLTADRLDRLDQLDRLDARDARDALDRREAADAADAKRLRLDPLDVSQEKEDEAAARLLLDHLMRECGQAHLVAGWAEPLDATRALSADERRLLKQLQGLQRSVAGGVAGYVTRAKKLLEDSRVGRNPLAGYAPSVPTGLTLEFGGASFLE